MTELQLTKTQLQQLAMIIEKFPDVELFTLRSQSTSGIGPTVHVSFTLWGKDPNTSIDITDFSSW